MAIHTVPWRKDAYPPMETILQNQRDAGIPEDEINRSYPAVRAGLQAEISKAVQQERGRVQPGSGR
jgi:hypothetical protein